MQALLKLPFFVILIGISAVAMFPPAIFAYQGRYLEEARAFFYSGSLLLIAAFALAITLSGRQPRNIGRNHLVTLVLSFVALPVIFSIPLQEARPEMTFLDAYFEMVSSFTTTGASVLPLGGDVAPVLHLWRAEVAWLGGLFVWVTAAGIFAPLHLGGFEVGAASEPGRGIGSAGVLAKDYETSRQLIRLAGIFVPIYAGLTVVLWICLILAGDTPFVAVSHAMSTLSTSGISPLTEMGQAQSGLGGEILIALFLVFALSRLTYHGDAVRISTGRLADDPEVRAGVLVALGVTILLFLRHWSGAYEAAEGAVGFWAGMTALWGNFFTVLSFMTTTGFASDSWADARIWSGLQTPGLILVGLALLGGGVATTAGGVKLLRVYALYIHGRRELGRLVFPSIVSTGAGAAGKLPRRGGYIAWIFFMLFALSIAATMMALSLTGLGFDEATVYAIAALSTTGPLASVASDGILQYRFLSDAAKIILMAAMVVGRLEILAIIALLNRDLWRG